MMKQRHWMNRLTDSMDLTGEISTEPLVELAGDNEGQQTTDHGQQTAKKKSKKTGFNEYTDGFAQFEKKNRAERRRAARRTHHCPPHSRRNGVCFQYPRLR